ncbi:hypothetical protein [Rariglobus hedericola]|uniref:Uncharacterized protein n=1 Tax=Rariglobus hedericola TaxID=2597822 RepID=A0A556QGP2_9BACT|nr:hypothetical protein [Rariglobus hedericola]TSJ75797.1 hypothetical protein FPL22_16160 [Rariglobus hedericola]
MADRCLAAGRAGGLALRVQQNDEREFSLMLAIFSVSAGMVGVCLTGIGLLQVVTSVKKAGTISDELLAVDAGLFLVCCLLIFGSFRLKRDGIRQRLQKAADTAFFLGLVLMAIICVLITMAFV